MPIEEIVSAVAEVVVEHVGGSLVEYGAQFLFSGSGGRYFHGIGRRVIALATLGRTRIPSSLRIVPKGTKPKPRRSDWAALFVGIFVWVAAIAGVIFAYYSQ
jgi:hypothetical protein